MRLPQALLVQRLISPKAGKMSAGQKGHAPEEGVSRKTDGGIVKRDDVGIVPYDTRGAFMSSFTEKIIFIASALVAVPRGTKEFSPLPFTMPFSLRA